MGSSTQLVLLAAAIHLAGLLLALVLILPVLRDDPAPVIVPPEDGEDGGGNDRPRPTAPSDPRGGGIPLPDAVPARVRRRERGRLGDLRPVTPRRGPAREPGRTPHRAPSRH